MIKKTIQGGQRLIQVPGSDSYKKQGLAAARMSFDSLH